MNSLETIEEAARTESGRDAVLLPVDAALPGMPAIQLGPTEQAAILQGRAVPASGPAASRVRMYGVGGRFLGVGRLSDEGARLAPERLMVEVAPAALMRA
jgi:hypothetical protein